MNIKPLKPVTGGNVDYSHNRRNPSVRTGKLEKQATPNGSTFAQELKRASGNLEPKKRTIVLIEDSSLRRLLCEEIKEEMPFINVRSFGDGYSFYGEINTGLEFDIAIVDLSLPGKIAGDDIIKYIHSINHYTPIISMSGSFYDNPFIKKHLLKPFDSSSLIKEIRKYLL